MAIPDFQSIMRPLLEHMADGDIKTNPETMEALGQYFDLTNEELAELLPSGQQPVFTNRVAWAKAHLKGAGLIEAPARGQYRIVPRGLDVLKQKDQKVNLAYLKQFEEYRNFREPNKSDENKAKSEPNIPDTLTPSEYIEHGYQKIREELES